MSLKKASVILDIVGGRLSGNQNPEVPRSQSLSLSIRRDAQRLITPGCHAWRREQQQQYPRSGQRAEWTAKGRGGDEKGQSCFQRKMPLSGPLGAHLYMWRQPQRRLTGLPFIENFVCAVLCSSTVCVLTHLVPTEIFRGLHFHHGLLMNVETES